MSNESAVKQRQSGIELLKIIAMFGIAFHHCLLLTYNSETSLFLNYIDISKPAANITTFLSQIFYYLGNLGNMIFLISSSWFLIENKYIKLNKVSHLISDSFAVTVILLLVLLIVGVQLPIEDIVSFLTPTINGDYWYISCYLLLYSIHPLLNLIINKLNQNQLLVYNSTFFLLYFGINSIKSGSFFVSHLILFVGIYFIVAYVKKYMINLISNKRVNIICFLIGEFLLILSQSTINLLGFYIDPIGSEMFQFANNNNPILLFIAFSLFNIFRSLKIKSNLINYVSSMTMLIYIIHCGRFAVIYVFKTFMFSFWELTGRMNFILFIFIFALLLFIASTFIAIAYSKLLQPWVHKLAEVILQILLRLYGRFECFMLKIE